MPDLTGPGSTRPRLSDHVEVRGLTVNARTLADEAICTALRPGPPVDYLRFAEDNIVFPPGEPRPGPYDRRSFKYFDAILQALSPSDPCRIVTLCASAQIGKTILGNVFALGSVVMGRGTAMIVHPSIENAARWSRMKLSPMMHSIPAVNALFPQRQRAAADAILYKERIDGLGKLLISGANSAASLSQVTAPYILEDDLAKWEQNSAGDPELQADSRARAHSFGKIFKISTPLTLPGCKITRNFEAGSREMPYIGCVHCGHRHVLLWENFHFEQIDNPYFVCPSCGGVLEQRHRQQMLDGFQWIAENPSAARTHRSFWLWSCYSVLQDWSLIAAEWQRAQGDSAGEQTFWTDTLGKAYQPEGDGRPPSELAARASKSHYARGVVPEGALILCCGVDVQIDRVEYQIVGFGEHYRKYVVDVGVIGKHISEPDCQRNLDLLVQRRWPNFRGRPVGISMTAVDAGFSCDDVLRFVHRHPPQTMIAVRGVPGDAAPLLKKVQDRNERTGTPLKFNSWFRHAGIYGFKASLYRDLAKDDPKEKGYISFPNNLPFDYYEQLVCERRVTYKHMGISKVRWEKPDRAANEMHDTMIYAMAAAVRFQVNWISDQGWAELRTRYEGPGPPPPPMEPRSLASQLAHSGMGAPAKKPTVAWVKLEMSEIVGPNIRLWDSVIFDANGGLPVAIVQVADNRCPIVLEIDGCECNLTVDVAGYIARQAASLLRAIDDAERAKVKPEAKEYIRFECDDTDAGPVLFVASAIEAFPHCRIIWGDVVVEPPPAKRTEFLGALERMDEIVRALGPGFGVPTGKRSLASQLANSSMGKPPKVHYSSEFGRPDRRDAPPPPSMSLSDRYRMKDYRDWRPPWWV